MKNRIFILVVSYIFFIDQCSSDGESKIVELTTDFREDGDNYEFHISKNDQREESSTFIVIRPNQVLKITNGLPIHVIYIVDENRYKPMMQTDPKEDSGKPMVKIGSRYNFDEQRPVSSAAIASIAGGGLGK